MDTKCFCIKMSASVMQMKIPKKFATNLKGRLCDNVKLKGPSGITWHVKLRKSKGTFILQSGWKDFVTANQIGNNDILLFKYCTSSSFEVTIFDPSGCENAASFFAKKTNTEVYSQESGDTSVEIVNEPHHKVQRDFIYITSGSDETSHEILSDTGRVCITGKRITRERDGSDDEVDFRASPQKKIRDSQMGMPSGSSNKRNQFIKSPYIVPRSVSLTSAQEKIALEMSCNAQPGNPTFFTPLTHYNVSGGRSCQMTIPARFAPSLKEIKSERLILRQHDKDKEWNAWYCNSRPRSICGCGWRDFVLQNKLKNGDLCLFELMNSEPKLIMTVHVFSM
ncbi:B3 domain-containing protein [Rhynchospora pubera]|uniref:B3 domain-containing protein n=1 Tax=Rhynchospora pubera TaxID=906938 RepID=A0AAV8DQ96_9POAL|nr:B3 domain-containing protein [Rhynchospora pubera]